MQSRTYRLDRFIAKHTDHSKGNVRILIAKGRVYVNQTVAVSADQIVKQFDEVILDGEVLQKNTPIYLMLNKPAGVVSATSDPQHTTVIDLLDDHYKDLHIAGRLDRFSTGLLLLTNDGEWSKSLSHPDNRVAKRYIVELQDPITDAYGDAFAKGMHFAYEDITTQPAQLKQLAPRVAEVTLHEGRYHQIKRMFGQFRNQVLSLHRVSIGNLPLDDALKPGEYRMLTKDEVVNITLQA